MNASRYPLTIYYDASCPLCAAEMHALRDEDHACRLRLVDCSASAGTAEERNAHADDEGLVVGDLESPYTCRERNIRARLCLGEPQLRVTHSGFGGETQEVRIAIEPRNELLERDQ